VIVIVGTVRLPPANIAAAKGPMEAMVTASRAEDGCIAYAYSEDLLEPGLVHVNELWRDRDALAAHFKTAHMATWRAAFGGLGITGRDLKLFDAGEPEAI
jgi:quinol monooxygenase YgiN